MKSTDLISRRIQKIPNGIIFGYQDLALPPEIQSAAAMALSRMVAENRLKKAGKGKFYKPIVSRLGEMDPTWYELSKDLLLKNDKVIGYITGVPIFALLGLTTQISSQIVVGSRVYRRPIQRGGYRITFTKQENEITETNIPLLRFLDAIKFIKKIPASTPDNTIEILQDKMNTFSNDEIRMLTNFAIYYPPSTRAILGAMMENIGKKTTKLKQTLNPLSRFKIGISETVLPNKSQWNIQ